ncbi:MAG TPA: GNAT family N-acetyltransferase [Candidatus Methylomirabilis sp.]|nr:GNAT family N-acetyltransferase [Candidatus Methylomirabilis sp.]
METNIITRREEMNVGKEEWNLLLSGSETNTVFQTYEWIWTWWNVFGHLHSLFLVEVREGGQLLALGPLMLVCSGWKRSLRFIGEDNSDYCDFIAGERKQDALKAIFDAIASWKEWNVIQLKNVPESSTTIAAVREFCGRTGKHFLEADEINCPTLIIRGYEDHARRVSRRKTIRRRHNYLRKTGDLKVFHLETVEEATRYFDLFVGQHIRRWSGTSSPSLFLKQGNRDFYLDLIEALLPRGLLLFTVLEYEDRPVAFHFGFDYGSKVLWYKPSFDPDYRRLSPGTVLLKYLIEYCIEQGRDELDFTIGDEPFKRKFANCVRKNGHYRIYNSQTGYYLEKAFRKFRYFRKLLI